MFGESIAKAIDGEAALIAAAGQPWLSDPNSYKGSGEKDPNGIAANAPGSKLDAGKAGAFQGLIGYFPQALLAVATVSTFGAGKYTWGGWRTVPNGVKRYSDAMVRHLIYEGQGETTDKDSELLHAAHTAWNALARLELMLNEGWGGD